MAGLEGDRPQAQHERRSPEGLTGPQVEFVKHLIGTGMFDLFTPDPEKGTPYTLRPGTAASRQMPLKDIIACFPEADTVSTASADFLWDYFPFDSVGIRKDMQRRPHSKRVWVAMDSLTGNVEELQKDGFEVITAFTILQAYDCGLRIMESKRKAIEHHIGASQRGVPSTY